jgi:hypothetical protein
MRALAKARAYATVYAIGDFITMQLKNAQTANARRLLRDAKYGIVKASGEARKMRRRLNICGHYLV